MSEKIKARKLARVSPRPKRGAPEETRARLVLTAAKIFNRDGFEGTDSNRIAKEAGYAAGVFYKHFADKTAIFIAVYDEWVTLEWRAIEGLLEHPNADTPRELVATVIELHRRWRVFRRSLRTLASRDPVIKRGHLQGRKRQLDTIARLREQGGVSQHGDRTRDLLLLYTLERAADALAENELTALEANTGELLSLLEALVAAALPASP